MDAIRYDEKLHEIKRIHDDSHHALRIAVCGKFKSGKSSLLNLMLNTTLPVQATTATGIITKVVYGNFSAVKLNNGEIKNVSKEELYDYISVVEKTLDGVTINDAQCALIGARSKLLHRGKVEFWDTPGLEDDDQLTQITMKAIKKSDMLIYVMHANQVLSYYEKRIIPKLHKRMNGNVIFVVNHMDSLRAEEMNHVISTVTNTLGVYTNSFLPNGNIFFTDANPVSPHITELLGAITSICNDKGKRLQILNSTPIGKITEIEEEWSGEIAEDIEDSRNKIEKFEKLITEDIQKKRDSLTAFYSKCVEKSKKIHTGLITTLSDEGSWRLALINYQSTPGWETNFVNGSAECIKGRMNGIIQQGNSDILSCVNNSVFEGKAIHISLDDKVVWKKANWVYNFSRPLLFPEARFKKFKENSINICISALMANPVEIVKNTVDNSFAIFFKAIEQQYNSEYTAVVADRQLTDSLEKGKSDLATVEEYKKKIELLKSDIICAKNRNKLMYRIRDFFAGIFRGLLENELYD